MATKKKVGRKKATPSASRKRQAMKRSQKQMKHKKKTKRPSWVAALKHTYDVNPEAKKEAKKVVGKTGRPLKRRRDDEEDNLSLSGSEAGAPLSHAKDEGSGFEVQEEITEEVQKRMNERQPLDTQLFLKGLPMDVTNDELTSFFSKLAPVKRVLVVRNKITKLGAGTAFVHFGSAEDATKVLVFATQNARELSAVGKEELKAKTEGMSHHEVKRLQFKMRHDAFLARDPFVTIRSSMVTVHRVMSRTDSQEATKAFQKKQKRTKVGGDDPRNLYLLQEGMILSDSPAAKGLPPQYLEMLQRDYDERKQTLKNTNYFVSRTRLSVRNIPRHLKENDLRRLFAEHARNYLKKHPEDLEKEKWGKYGPIKNVKVLYDPSGMSRGYGFIEFVNHNVALSTLRTINNNPTIFGTHKRLLVSFAVENMNAIQKLQRLKELKSQRLSNKQDYTE